MCKSRLKKMLAWGVLLFGSFSIFVFLVAFVQSSSVNAVMINGMEQGDRNTMYKKIAYGAFENCVNEAKKNTFDYEVIDGILGIGHHGMKTSKLRSGNWFNGNGNILLGDVGTAYGVGGLLERLLIGNYKDGYIRCGENSNALMSKLVNSTDYLNLKDSYVDILCDGKKSRIFIKGSVGDSCTETLNDPDGYYLSPTAQLGGGIGYSNDVSVNPSKEDYLDLIVKEKAFGGDIPGGSLYELTDLEQYFLLNDTFINVCTSDKNGSDDSSLTYSIFVRDASTDELVKKYFPGVSKPSKNTKIPIRKKGTAVVRMSCKEIAETLGNEDSPEIKAYKEYIKQVSSEEEDRQPVSAADDQVCYDNSGALGWIICPIIQGVSGIGKWLWGEIETNFLQVPVDKFFADNRGIETAWQTFRDIANVAFIILFLIVIFSQLTGIGIDNYGIKKIMPKLIVTAILINLSYVICLLAVDLSNILGSGLNALFQSLADQIPVELKDASVGQGLAVAGIGGGGLVIFGLIAGPLGLVSAGLWVFGIMITIVVSMLFLFLVLLVRSAGIVILIAIAPVAIVCYMLPNTEKLFKRWFDLFRAILFVYPICGALVGAGKLAGNLLASTDLEAMKLAGMIVEVLPFFLIPTLLKQSLSLAGNIGARLSSVGKNLGHRGASAATGAIKGSEGFKNWSNSQQGAWNANRASRVMRRLEKAQTKKQAKGGELSKWQQARYRNAQDTVLAQKRVESENKRRTQRDYFEAATQEMADDVRRKEEATRVALRMDEHKSSTIGKVRDAWNKAFDEGNDEELSALTTVMYRKFGSAGMTAITSELGKKKTSDANFEKSMSTLQRTLSENSNMAGDMRTKTPDAYQMISNGGHGSDDEGYDLGLKDLSWFSVHNNIATKTKDWVTSSTGALKRGLAAEEKGKKQIDDHMLDELLMSDDPAIKAFRSNAENRKLLQAAKRAREEGVSFASVVGNDKELERLSEEYESNLSAQQAAEKSAQDTASQVRIETAIRNALGVNSDGAGGSTGTGGGTGGSTGTGGTGGSTGTGGGSTGGSGTSRTISPTPVPIPGASGASAASGEYVEYDNISGRSSMMLREMPDGTLRDDSGNAYNPQRWKRRPVPAPQPQIQPAQSGQRLDTTTPFSEARANPQPRSTLRNAPQTSRGIVLPGDTTSISGMADEARRNPPVPPQNPPQP